MFVRKQQQKKTKGIYARGYQLSMHDVELPVKVLKPKINVVYFTPNGK
jgi:hypothetical protein